MQAQQEEQAAENAAPVLEGWISRKEMAGEIGVSVDTLARWETQRRGPPCVRIGRGVYYRIEAFREWLRQQESRKAGARR